MTERERAIHNALAIVNSYCAEDENVCIVGNLTVREPRLLPTLTDPPSPQKLCVQCAQPMENVVVPFCASCPDAAISERAAEMVDALRWGTVPPNVKVYENVPTATADEVRRMFPAPSPEECDHGIVKPVTGDRCVECGEMLEWEVMLPASPEGSGTEGRENYACDALVDGATCNAPATHTDGHGLYYCGEHCQPSVDRALTTQPEAGEGEMSEVERYARHLEAEIDNLRRSLAAERKLTEEAKKVLDHAEPFLPKASYANKEARDWLTRYTAFREPK